MNRIYVHGYDRRESLRLQDQAETLVDLLHSDTSYPEGSSVLEAGCGIGAQTIPLARNSPGARIVSVDISAASLAERSEEHTSELQSRSDLVCRLLLEKKKTKK